MRNRLGHLIFFFMLLLSVLWFGGFFIFCKSIFSYTTLLAAENVIHKENISPSQQDARSEDVFVAYKDYPELKSDVRLIALYLPQFHQFEENNLWHGRGFTEWSNVTAAKPQFSGHYQPKLPIDVGFYDLAHDDVMFRQIELAKNYGLGGFAFYYYWFSGKKLMEKPIYNYLANKELDFPFCLHWANESWSKKWDGGNQELLITQNFTEDDFEAFAKDLLPFFKDSRYIKINDRPLFIIYRVGMFDKVMFKKFTQYLDAFMEDNGIKAPYLVGTKSFGFYENPADWGLDAVIDFQINEIYGLQEKNVQKFDDKAFFKVFDWAKYINAGKYYREFPYKTFRLVFPAWDNTARKAYSGALIFDGSTPDIYGQWLDYAVKATEQEKTGEEKIVFINAWNEWAEGAYLEPDKRYGYAYLDMTRAVMDKRFQETKPSVNPVGIAVLTGGRNRLQKGIELLNQSVGDRLLVSGVQPGVNFQLISSREDVVLKNSQPIDLGYQARDTVGNAIEVKKWANEKGMDEIYVVTSFYHIPRTRLEFERILPDKKLHFVAVDSKYVSPKWWKNWRSFKFLTREYVKFLFVYIQYKWLGL